MLQGFDAVSTDMHPTASTACVCGPGGSGVSTLLLRQPGCVATVWTCFVLVQAHHHSIAIMVG
jgi:hypothetical protein